MAATLLISPPLPRQFITTLSRALPPRGQETSFPHHRIGRVFRIHAIPETTEKETETSSSPEEITKKYGLELGLWKIFRSGEEEKGVNGAMKKKSKADQAKELLAKYGGAYLATSITLSLISFSLCYLLVTAGIDVQALLSKLRFPFPFSQIRLREINDLYEILQIGIAVDETGEKVGAFALAYAAHKAASPIRFPPTVALTAIVAGWIRKKSSAENDDK